MTTASLKRIEADFVTLGAFERVRRNPVAVATWVNDAARHLESAARLAQDDPRLAYAACHDAIRKALTGLLADRGLRTLSGEGGHLRVQEWGIVALEGVVDAETLAGIDLVRRQRHQAEYGELASQMIGAPEVMEALRVATAVVDGVKRLLSRPSKR